VSTVVRDDPQLTARGLDGLDLEQQPVRVVVDSEARIPLDSRVLVRPGRVVLAVSSRAPEHRVKSLRDLGVEVEVFGSRRKLVDLNGLLDWLGKQDLIDVLVEGGQKIWTSMFEGNWIDKVLVFVAPVLIGGNQAPTPFGGKGITGISEASRLRGVKIAPMGQDDLVSGYLD